MLRQNGLVQLFSSVSGDSGWIISGPELAFCVGRQAGVAAATRANFLTTNFTAMVALHFGEFAMTEIGNVIGARARVL